LADSSNVHTAHEHRKLYLPLNIFTKEVDIAKSDLDQL
jgi:hypothetical protein